jgi:hypothetical protein
MDFLEDGWPPHMFSDQLLLTEEEMQHAVDYITASREAFEVEYKEVVEQAEEEERYGLARQQEIEKKISERQGPPPNLSPEQAAAWSRLMYLRSN